MLFCLNAGAWADNVVQVSSAEGAPDEEVTIHVSLLNTDEIASLQISIPLDENLSFVEGSGIIGNRCGSHSLTVGVMLSTRSLRSERAFIVAFVIGMILWVLRIWSVSVICPLLLK